MKKNYVSPCILLLTGGDPGAETSPYNPDNDPSLGAKQGDLSDFGDFDKEKFSR